MLSCLVENKMPFQNLLNISVQKDWVDYLSALLTPTVAIFGLYIAYRQRLLEEVKLRHELFDRRYKQFTAVTKFVLFSVAPLSINADEECATYAFKAGDNLWSEIAGMRFIFSSEIEQYVSKYIIEPYLEIQQLRSDYNRIAPGEERQNNAARQWEIKNELRKNLQTFQEKTSEYMQLHQPFLPKKLWRHLAALWEKIQKAAE